MLLAWGYSSLWSYFCCHHPWEGVEHTIHTTGWTLHQTLQTRNSLDHNGLPCNSGSSNIIRYSPLSVCDRSLKKSLSVRSVYRSSIYGRRIRDDTARGIWNASPEDYQTNCLCQAIWCLFIYCLLNSIYDKRVWCISRMFDVFLMHVIRTQLNHHHRHSHYYLIITLIIQCSY